MKYKNSTNKFPSIFLFIGLIVSVCSNVGCGNPPKANNNAANRKVENKVNDFQTDLQTMKTAGFDHIFVFRRKDGGILDGEDKAYVKANSPAATNRFILSDDDKAVIAGSGFEFPNENLDALKKRFNVEDYSSPKPSNQNSAGSNSVNN